MVEVTLKKLEKMEKLKGYRYSLCFFGGTNRTLGASANGCGQEFPFKPTEVKGLMVQIFRSGCGVTKILFGKPVKEGSIALSDCYEWRDGSGFYGDPVDWECCWPWVAKEVLDARARGKPLLIKVNGQGDIIFP